MNINNEKTNNSCEINPSQVEFNQIAYERGLLSTKEKVNFTRGEKGMAGENRISNFITENGRPNWTIIRNMWLSDDSPFECDVILITKYAIHTFEVKNYTGRFTYENGSCKIGNIKMEHDCIQQARKSFLKLQKICKKFNYHLPVNGSIIFSSPKNKVVINSPVEDIHVLEMPDLYEYLQNIKQAEDLHPAKPIDFQRLIEHLENYRIADLYLPASYSSEKMTTTRKGICCGMCRSFDIEHSKHYIHCDCGFHESREEAIVRSACEYGVLTYDRNFSTGDISEFIGKQVSRKLLKNTLGKHFRHILKQKYSYYENYGRDYPIVLSKFQFIHKAYFYNTNRSTYKRIFKYS